MTVEALAGQTVVGPDDIGALEVHIMTNTAVTGATVMVDAARKAH